MVALAILGVAVVAVFQVYSIGLRSSKKAEDYTKALFYARSLLDQAYSMPEPETGSEPFDLKEDFRGVREINLKSASEDEKVKTYELVVTITWPPSGSLKIKGLRTVHEFEFEGETAE
jgi:hypothetical protein